MHTCVSFDAHDMCTALLLFVLPVPMHKKTTEAMHTPPDQPTHALAALSGDKNVNHSVNKCEEVVLL